MSDFVVAAKQQALDALRDEDPFARKELEASCAKESERPECAVCVFFPAVW